LCTGIEVVNASVNALLIKRSVLGSSSHKKIITPNHHHHQSPIVAHCIGVFRVLGTPVPCSQWSSSLSQCGNQGCTYEDVQTNIGYGGDWVLPITVIATTVAANLLLGVVVFIIHCHTKHRAVHETEEPKQEDAEEPKQDEATSLVVNRRESCETVDDDQLVYISRKQIHYYRGCGAGHIYCLLPVR
jgi:hypothetical protein